MTEPTVEDWQRVAAHLLGHPVRVRFVDNAIVRGAGGAAYYDPDGCATIEILNDRPELVQWRTFLHEAAHLAHHHPAGRVAAPGPHAITNFDFDDSHRLIIEREADSLADVWGKYVDDRTRPYHSNGTRLLILSYYPRAAVTARQE